MGADLRELHSYTDANGKFPFFKGFAFFEWTVRHDKGDPGQDLYGMFDFGEKELCTMYGGQVFWVNFSVRCLTQKEDMNNNSEMRQFKEIFASGNTAADER